MLPIPSHDTVPLKNPLTCISEDVYSRELLLYIHKLPTASKQGPELSVNTFIIAKLTATGDLTFLQ
jgi:hypothetical protein